MFSKTLVKVLFGFGGASMVNSMMSKRFPLSYLVEAGSEDEDVEVVFAGSEASRPSEKGW